MSELYRAWINEAETAPMTLAGLAQMAEAGQIQLETPVRGINNKTWSTWADFNRVRTLSQDGKIACSLRDGVRATTAYSGLRNYFNILFWLDIAGVGVFAILIFVDPSRSLFYIAGAGACAFGIIPLALANVVLDIADYALRKEARDS